MPTSIVHTRYMLKGTKPVMCIITLKIFFIAKNIFQKFFFTWSTKVETAKICDMIDLYHISPPRSKKFFFLTKNKNLFFIFFFIKNFFYKKNKKIIFLFLKNNFFYKNFFIL